MRDRYGKLVYIVAVNKLTLNDDLKELLKSNLKVIKPLFGCYKGKLERSYLVEGLENSDAQEAQHQIVADFLALNNQESALFLDEDRNAYLLYPTGEFSDKLGVFREARNVEADENWTLDLVTKTYYTVS